MANGKAILGRYRKAAGVSKNLQKQMTNLAVGEIEKEEIGTRFSTGREIATNIYETATNIKGYLDERETAKRFKADLDIAIEAAPGVEKTEGRFGVTKYQRKVIDKEAKTGWKYEDVEPYKLYSEFHLGYEEDERGYFDRSKVYMPPPKPDPSDKTIAASLEPKTDIDKKGEMKTTQKYTVPGSGKDVTEPAKNIEDALVDEMKEADEGVDWLDNLWDKTGEIFSGDNEWDLDFWKKDKK
jgi:hypothetical protein